MLIQATRSLFAPSNQLILHQARVCTTHTLTLIVSLRLLPLRSIEFFVSLLTLVSCRPRATTSPYWMRIRSNGWFLFNNHEDDILMMIFDLIDLLIELIGLLVCGLHTLALEVKKGFIIQSMRWEKKNISISMQRNEWLIFTSHHLISSMTAHLHHARVTCHVSRVVS